VGGVRTREGRLPLHCAATGNYFLLTGGRPWVADLAARFPGAARVCGTARDGCRCTGCWRTSTACSRGPTGPCRKARPGSIRVRDPATGLFPVHLAAANAGASVEAVFRLAQLCPEALLGICTGGAREQQQEQQEQQEHHEHHEQQEQHEHHEQHEQHEQHGEGQQQQQNKEVVEEEEQQQQQQQQQHEEVDEVREVDEEQQPAEKQQQQPEEKQQLLLEQDPPQEEEEPLRQQQQQQQQQPDEDQVAEDQDPTSDRRPRKTRRLS
jgi:hypothetical protein